MAYRTPARGFERIPYVIKGWIISDGKRWVTTSMEWAGPDQATLPHFYPSKGAAEKAMRLLHRVRGAEVAVAWVTITVDVSFKPEANEDRKPEARFIR